MFHIFIRTVLVGILTLSAAVAMADPQPMNGSKIKETISGRVVYLSTPLGTELPIHYRKNGTMFGKGGNFARYLSDEAKPTDRGRWWVSGASLCQKWRSWLEGRKYCFSLKMAGSTVYWRSSDGRSGTARLGRSSGQADASGKIGAGEKIALAGDR